MNPSKVPGIAQKRTPESPVNTFQKASVWLIFKERFPIVYGEGSQQQEASQGS